MELSLISLQKKKMWSDLMKKNIILFCLIAAFIIFSACSITEKKPSDDPSINNTEDPVIPDTPSVPDEPSLPDHPGNPDSPSIPDEPTTPDEPILPDDPDTPVAPVGNMNPLTGLYDGISDDALNTRPIAIMVGNTSDALPQWGVSKADIIYEMLAEGRSTRLLCIFQDHTKIDKIASIRSARPYFIDIAQSYGAVYMHFGGSVPAVEQIAIRKDLIHIDGIKGSWEGTVVFRDPDRRKELGFEHSVYTTGDYLTLGLSKLKVNLEQTEHPSAFKFGEEHSAANGTDMTKVQITYKEKHKPYFVYDAESGKYLRFQYNKPQIDGLNNEQIAVTNLLVLRMEITDIKNNSLGIIDVNTLGTGNGYYFCGGKYVEITWSKESYNSPILFYTKDGKELVCSPGQTFVSVATRTGSITIE